MVDDICRAGCERWRDMTGIDGTQMARILAVIMTGQGVLET